MQFFKGLTLGFSACLLFGCLLLFGPVLAAHQTILDQGFASNEIQKLDTAQLAGQLLPESLPGNLQPYSAIIQSTIQELKPWIDSQTKVAVGSTYDFLSGNSPDLGFSINAEIVRQTLLKQFDAAFKASPPPQYNQLSPVQRQQLLIQSEQQLKDLLPLDLTVRFDRKTLGSDTALVLDQLKTAYGFTQKTFLAILLLGLLFLILVILVLRQAKGIARTLGIVLLLAGGLGYAAFRLLSWAASQGLEYQDWPAQIQAWVPGLARDILAPFGAYALALLVLGAVLLAASFFFRPDQ